MDMSDFFAILERETTLTDTICLQITWKLSKLGATLKEKNLLPAGENSFL